MTRFGTRAPSGSVLHGLPNPGRYVPRSMQDAPDIDFRLPLDVEDQIRKLPYGPEAQAGKIQFMRMAERAACRLFANTVTGVFQRVEEGERHRLSRLGQIMLDRLVNIPPRPLAKDDRLAAHRRPALRIRSRSRSK